ncbi:MAG: phosphoenolpyruvate--protein phosphotransferase [Oscillospiraceae bacterium]
MKIQGLGASSGIAVAQAVMWHPLIEYNALPRLTKTPEIELSRFLASLKNVIQKNQQYYAEAKEQGLGEEAGIFEAHCIILQDKHSVEKPVQDMIEIQHYTAEYAVSVYFEALAQRMLALKNEYMRQRADDFYSLREQLIRDLMGLDFSDISHLGYPSIVVANNLSPANIARLDKSRLEGFVCQDGGFTSHAAIIARTLGLPAVLAADDIVASVKNGDLLAIDGSTGEVWIQPEPEILAELRERSKDQYASLKGITKNFLPTVTPDGRRIEVGANMGQVADIQASIDAGAECVGLFRTEILHISTASLPSEEEQYNAYSLLLEKFSNRSVTVRTLDIGFHLPHQTFLKEESPNPALGYRGIRMSLGRPSLFRPQLRALLRASARGGLKIVYPMISSVQELEDSKRALQEIKNELEREDILFNAQIPTGIMIEVPSAALCADILAENCDFFAIGLNDLIQFTLAVDRNNHQVSPFYSVLNPGVLRLVQMTLEAAKRKGIPYSICGDVPDMRFALPVFMGFGAESFSFNTSFLPLAKIILNNCTFEDCQILARQILLLTKPSEIREACRIFLEKRNILYEGIAYS